MKYILLLFMVTSVFAQDNDITSGGQIDYNSILNGLNLSYVEFVQSTEKQFESNILNFYKKDYSEYQKDSATYNKALTDFYNSDSTILDFLMQFKVSYDNCDWLEGSYSTHHPFSSHIDVCYSQFLSKEKNASLMLAFNYIFNKEKRKFQLLKEELTDCKVETNYWFFEEYLRTKSSNYFANLETKYNELFDTDK